MIGHLLNDTLRKGEQFKEILAYLVKSNLRQFLRRMQIPTRQQLESYEKRVEILEHQIGSLGRRLLSKQLSRKSGKGKKKR